MRTKIYAIFISSLSYNTFEAYDFDFKPIKANEKNISRFLYTNDLITIKDSFNNKLYISPTAFENLIVKSSPFPNQIIVRSRNSDFHMSFTNAEFKKEFKSKLENFVKETNDINIMNFLLSINIEGY